MTREQFARERDYGAAAAIAGEMAARGLISPEEHVDLNARLHQKMKPVVGRISAIYDATVS